jgi:predicted small secreted protein
LHLARASHPLSIFRKEGFAPGTLSQAPGYYGVAHPFGARRAGIVQEEINMSKKIVATLLLSSALVLSACNTVEGAGKDVQSAGKAVEKSAD